MSNYLRMKTRQYLRERRRGTAPRPLGERIIESMARSARSTKWNLATMIQNGWTTDQIDHWLETGEEPTYERVYTDAIPRRLPAAAAAGENNAAADAGGPE